MGQKTLILMALLASLGVPAASGQWSAVRLHDPALRQSSALAGNAQTQGGIIYRAGSVISEPAIWSGSAQSWVSFATAPNTSGQVNAVWGGAQGGVWAGHASLWAGTAASRIDLHPAGSYAESTIMGMRDSQQAGYVWTGAQVRHAGMWSGTAGSFVDLHPAFAEESQAGATDGIQQGGAFTINGGYAHAALWSGSATSVIDLNPGPLYTSGITCMVPGQQGGRISLGLPSHAAIWSGTPGSVVDLHPFPGFGESLVTGTTGTAQSGFSDVPGSSSSHACVWLGSAGSFIDLHSLLPEGYSSSVAHGIWQDGSTLYVIGGAATPAGLSEAWMWVGAVPSPGTGSLLLVSAATIALRRRRSKASACRSRSSCPAANVPHPGAR